MNQNGDGGGRRRGGQPIPLVFERAWAARAIFERNRAASSLHAALIVWLEERADELDRFTDIVDELGKWESNAALSERSRVDPAIARPTMLKRAVYRLVHAKPGALADVIAIEKATRRPLEEGKAPASPTLRPARCFVCKREILPGEGRIPSVITPITERELPLETSRADERVVRRAEPRRPLAACADHLDQLAAKLPDVRVKPGRGDEPMDLSLITHKCDEHDGGWGQPRHCEDVDGLGPAIEVRGTWPDTHGQVEAVAWLRHARADCLVAWLQIATELVDDARAQGGVVLRTRSAPRPDEAPKKGLGFVMVRCTSPRKRSAAA